MEAFDSEALKKELAQVRRELADTKMIFNSILETTLSGYWDWRIKDNYEYMSPTFKKMLGYEDHELENSPETRQRIIHTDDLPEVLRTFEKHVKSKGEFPYDNEVRYYHKDGSVVWVYCRGKVIEWDKEGRPVRMVGSYIDITKLKKAQQQEQNIREQLQHKNKEMEQFAYVASHDLQEPLRTVSSFAELLADDFAGKLGKEGDQYIQYITQASARMRTLIKGLLDHSRIGKGREKTVVDCNKLLDEIVADLAASLQDKGGEVYYGKMPEIIAYETELRMLFQNLISNAVKFSAQEVSPQINISYTMKNRNHQFCVEDNGIGIEPRYYDRIFAIFQRLHTRNQYDGTGIGLAHCAKIAEIHNGGIWVESTPGAGSKFYFTIQA